MRGEGKGGADGGRGKGAMKAGRYRLIRVSRSPTNHRRCRRDAGRRARTGRLDKENERGNTKTSTYSLGSHTYSSMGSARRGCGDERCVAGGQRDRGRLQAEAAVGAAAAAAAAVAAVDPWWRFVGVSWAAGRGGRAGQIGQIEGCTSSAKQTCVCARARVCRRQQTGAGCRVYWPGILVCLLLGCAWFWGSWFLFGAGCFCGCCGAVLLCFLGACGQLLGRLGAEGG